ncbi:MAG TPA: YafY family protein [Mobilitalea sp.]|nr:YafY family protein [Mobilitalea sp.]
MQINRLFEIVYILMNKKNVTAKELGERFEVSQRTIYRDIETLCQAGIPIYTNKGKGGGICLMEHFVLNKSVLSDQEQKDILSALQGFKAANYTDTDQILSKLNSLFGNKNPDWIEVDFSYWNSNEEDKRKFHQLKDAILNYQVIQFDYYNSYGQESSRTLEPRKLIFKGQAWYLSGYCRDKKSFRFFKISRIKGLTITSEIFTPMPYQEPEDEPQARISQQTTEVVLKAAASMAYRVFDEFPAETVQRQEDGSFLIHTKLFAGGWIYGYLMSYEDQLEVLEPVELRNDIIKRYKNALNNYNMTY